ncbi:hypothetical protein FACS1894167_01980 [Synergistales bacterium]|nr:hypothetical protein FACS1894167_01980 [Synergistales bacterium]GHV49777.1 hypothetical protein FACS1894216_00800 [Synergistales bacterium]
MTQNRLFRRGGFQTRPCQPEPRLCRTFLKFAGFLSAVVLCLFISAASFADDAHLLVIFHTNDVHGHAITETDRDGRIIAMGYDRLKAIVDGEAAKHKMLLDAGDVLHGTAFATAKRGELAARAVSLLGYDAIAVGNHEFDYGPDRLLELRDKYRLPFLSANTKKKSDGKLIFPPYSVTYFEDLRVGVFGLTTPMTETSTDPKNVISLSFGTQADLTDTAREMTRILRENLSADIVIALTHVGSEPYCEPMSQAIARAVPGIDIIIDGHSHSVLPDLRVNNTLITSTGAYSANTGRITVDRKSGGGFAMSSVLIPASDAEKVVPNPELSWALTALDGELNRELSGVVAVSPTDFNGERKYVRSGSTNLGRVICAALIKETGADAAFLNGGTIRGSIASGDITKKDILTVLPYANYVRAVNMKGSDLLASIKYGLSEPGSGAFPQFYGMSVSARESFVIKNGAKIDSLEVESVTIKGQPLDENAVYKIATNDFISSGGDGYSLFAGYDYDEFGTLNDAFLKFISEASADELAAIDGADVIIIKQGI